MQVQMFDVIQLYEGEGRRIAVQGFFQDFSAHVEKMQKLRVEPEGQLTKLEHLSAALSIHNNGRLAGNVTMSHLMKVALETPDR